MEKARKATAKASRSMVSLDSRALVIKSVKAKARVIPKARKDKAKEEERKAMEKASQPLFLCYQNPNRKQVNQVEQTVAGSGSPAPSTVGPSASQHPQQSIVSTATTVRRVDACEPLIF